MGSLDNVTLRAVTIEVPNWTLGNGMDISNEMITVDGTQTSNTTLRGLFPRTDVGTSQLTYTLSNVQPGGGDTFIDRIVLQQGSPALIPPTTNGTHTIDIEAGSNSNGLAFLFRQGFIGNIDNVSLRLESPAWTLGDGMSISSSSLMIDGTQTSRQSFSQDITSVSTGIYRVTYEMSSVTGGLIRFVSVGDGIVNRPEGPSASDGTFTHDIIVGDGILFELEVSPDFIGNFDMVTVSERTYNGNDWTTGDGVFITDGKIVCNGSQTSETSFSQSESAFTSDEYLIEYDLSSITQGSIVGVSVGGGDSVVPVTSNGNHTIIATSAGTSEFVVTLSDDFIGNFDNISVKSYSVDIINPEARDSTVGISMTRNNVLYGPLLYRDLGELGDYTNHLEWNYPGGLGSYDGFMGIRIYTTQNVEFDANGLFAYFRS